MRIDVTRADVGISAVLRGRVVRRVLLTLSRFGPRLRKVSVRLSEPRNPLGGVDQRCRMRVWLQERNGIHAEAINGGFEAAVSRAARQLAKRMDLALDGGGRTRPRPLGRAGRQPQAIPPLRVTPARTRKS